METIISIIFDCRNNYFEEHVCMMESVASQTQSLAAALDLLSISAVPMVPKRNYYVSAIIYLLTQNMGQVNCRIYGLTL